MIHKGFIASRNGIPVFVYNQNEVVELTDESQELALKMNGDKVEAKVDTYFPDARVRAKLVIQGTPEDLKSRKIAWEMYKAVRYTHQGKNFEDTWNHIKTFL